MKVQLFHHFLITKIRQNRPMATLGIFLHQLIINFFPHFDSQRSNKGDLIHLEGSLILVVSLLVMLRKILDNFWGPKNVKNRKYT